MSEEIGFRPLRDGVVVFLEEKETVTKSGIIMATQDDGRNKYRDWATVVAIGAEVPADVTVGVEVLYERYAGKPLSLRGKEYLFLNYVDLLAVKLA